MMNWSLVTGDWSLFNGVFYQSDRPTKNALEKKWIETTREKTGNLSDVATLQKTFDKMK